MKIESLKELEKFIALCRKTGITDVKIDGMEFHLGPVTPKAPRQRRVYVQEDALAQAQITIPKFGGAPTETPEQAREKYSKRKNQKTIEVTETINTPDELSEEDLLFYSAGGASQVAGEEQ